MLVEKISLSLFSSRWMHSDYYFQRTISRTSLIKWRKIQGEYILLRFFGQYYVYLLSHHRLILISIMWDSIKLNERTHHQRSLFLWLVQTFFLDVLFLCSIDGEKKEKNRRTNTLCFYAVDRLSSKIDAYVKPIFFFFFFSSFFLFIIVVFFPSNISLLFCDRSIRHKPLTHRERQAKVALLLLLLVTIIIFLLLHKMARVYIWFMSFIMVRMRLCASEVPWVCWWDWNRKKERRLVMTCQRFPLKREKRNLSVSVWWHFSRLAILTKWLFEQNPHWLR